MAISVTWLDVPSLKRCDTRGKHFHVALVQSTEKKSRLEIAVLIQNNAGQWVSVTVPSIPNWVISAWLSAGLNETDLSTARPPSNGRQSPSRKKATSPARKSQE